MLHVPNLVESLSDFGVMGCNDQSAFAGFGPCDQRCDHLAARRVIKLSGRLVGKKQPRTACHGPGQSDALRLSARQLVGKLVGKIDQSEPRQLRVGRYLRGCSSLPSTKIGRATFSQTLRNGTRLGAWNATEIFPGTRPVPSPNAGHSMRPSLGRSRPAIRCSSVDLPLPEAPMMATLVAGRMAHVADLSASISLLPCR